MSYLDIQNKLNGFVIILEQKVRTFFFFYFEDTWAKKRGLHINKSQLN